MSAPNETIIRVAPSRGWGAVRLREIWSYRDLLYFLIWREIKSRYRQMAFGPLWIVLVPFANMIVFSVVFGQWAGLQTDGLPPALFYFAALLPWQYFSVSATKSTRSLVDNLNLVSKVYFPRTILPVSTAMVGILDFLVSFVVLLGIMAWYHVAPHSTAVLLPAYLLLTAACALTVGFWLASIAVWFRDVAYGVQFLMQIWMFATVVFPSGQVPERWRLLYRLNPMQTVVEGFRWSLLGSGQRPDIVHAVTAASVLVLLIGGALVFQRTERSVVDIL